MIFQTSSLLLLSLASSVYALTINTPASVVECQPLQLSWSNGSAPYYLAVIPGGDTATTLENLPTQESATSYTWTCDIASGTSIGFRVTDSTGLIAYTDSVTVQSGSDTSCVGSSSSSSSSSNSTAPGSSGSSNAAASSSASSESSTSSRLSTTTRSSSSAASTASTSAAGSNNAATTSSTSGAFASLHMPSILTLVAGLGLLTVLA
ncbi:hypothetical protein P389DRAFT_210952 [Cystobasidium minutum MCA 4210]|uniref:uncharacterized protein n=1 Tax=Cystobasidium minutum MCA 4210 TaxID=1397322 RepID=UPI0034CFC886|eukprot:jgi/Rhomi1/210952/estExt_Genemark1.C_4_t20048